MKYLILNQNTDNYGDDIAAQALTYIIRSADTSAEIRFLYGPRPWSGTVPVLGKEISHRVMTSMGGKTSYLDLFRTYLHRKFRVKPNYRNDEFKKLSSDLNWCDHVMVSPSGANIGIYQDWNALKVTMQVVAHGKQLIFHLNTIGSSGNMLFDLLARTMLRKSLVFVREARCLSELKAWGVESKFGPDSAFALPAASRPSTLSPTKIIGLVPTGLNWHPDHQDSKSLFIVDQLDKTFIERVKSNPSLIVHIIPHLYGHMDETELLLTVKESLVKKGIPTAQIEIATWVKSADEYDQAIAACHIVITMRYHGVVLAAKNAVPFFALSYESKMKEACRYTRMDQYCVDIKSSTPELVAKKISSILEQHDEISTFLKENSSRLSKMTYYPIYQSIYLEEKAG